MSDGSNLPEVVNKAFPMLVDAVFVRQLASPVPLSPDTTFDIYVKPSKDFIALVTTDYADPQYQSEELKRISGQHEFEFSNLIKPYDQDNVIAVLGNDDIDNEFFIVTSNNGRRLYYYLANIF